MPRCRVSDCKVQYAVFNTPGEKKGLCCLKHKEECMIDVVNKRCVHAGCLSINPSFNYENEKSGLFCAQHKLADMINVHKKKCFVKDCKNKPVCTVKAEVCQDHYNKPKGKKCIEPTCNTIPSFNMPGKRKGLFCAKHKHPQMINVVCKLCAVKNCNKQPSFNFVGAAPLFCKEHMENGMINVRSSKSIKPESVTQKTYFKKTMMLVSMICLVMAYFGYIV